jgi:hypothetical protein
MAAASWNYAPATSGHNATKAQHTGSEPFQARDAVDLLMTMFKPSAQMAVTSVGSITAGGTGTVTITVTAT